MAKVVLVEGKEGKPEYVLESLARENNLRRLPMPTMRDKPEMTPTADCGGCGARIEVTQWEWQNVASHKAYVYCDACRQSSKEQGGSSKRLIFRSAS